MDETQRIWEEAAAALVAGLEEARRKREFQERITPAGVAVGRMPLPAVAFCATTPGETAYGIGLSEAERPGYWPINLNALAILLPDQAARVRKSWDDARDVANMLNGGLGISARDAVLIVASSMRGTAVRE